MLNLDSFQQYLLATDRDNAKLAPAFETLHPFVLRALAKACRVAAAEERPLEAFGVSAWQPENRRVGEGVGFSTERDLRSGERRVQNL